MRELNQPSSAEGQEDVAPLRALAVTMRWGGHWRRWRWWLALLLSFAFMVAGGFGMFSVRGLVNWASSGPPSVPQYERAAKAIALFAMALMTMGCIGRVWLAYWRWNMSRVCRETPPDATELAFFRAERVQLGGALVFRSKTRAKWVELARSTGVITWVDQRVADDVLHLPRIDRPIEPERVGTFWQQVDSRFGAIAGLIGGFQMMAGNTLGGSIWLGVAALALTRLLRRGALFEPVVAGQGWIQHGRARWTVNDSVTVIKRRARNGLNITVIGPAGVLKLQVSRRGPKDDSLREFWQRWCHPTPRIEQAAFDA